MLDAMTETTRRTPEKLAAYYQGKANKARARAQKAARNRALKERLALGDAAKAAGVTSVEDLKVRLLIADLTTQGFTRGNINYKGEFHLAAFVKLFKPKVDDQAALASWWLNKGYPAGPGNSSETTD